MPGLLEQIAERFGLDLASVPFVGDTLNDMKAAEAAGCIPHLVFTGKSEVLRDKPLPSVFPAGTAVHKDLHAFVDALLKKSQEPAL